MNMIQNLLRVAIIVIFTFFAFGSSLSSQAASNLVEPDQFSCANVTEIPLSECEALVAIYNPSGSEATTPCNWHGVTCEEGHITEIDFSFRFFDQLDSIPPEIGDLTNLTHLILSYNRLSSLPSEIRNLTNLIELDLSSNQLDSLPAEIGNLTNLTHLILPYNRLSSLPSEIKNLTKLIELDVSSNQLSNLTAEIGNLTTLTEFNVFSNQLSHLPTEIGHLMNLIELDLSSNQLDSLPAEIGNLTNLTKFNVSFNQLSRLPAEIDKLNNLITLDLSRNRLNSLPSKIGKLNNLTALYIYQNQLNSLPADFIELADLDRLSIDFNYLVDVSAEQRTFLTEKDPEWADTQVNATICNDVREVPQHECEALMAIYNFYTSDRPEDWLKTQTPCQWSGITCENDHVAELFLASEWLRFLPPEIGNFSYLTRLQLSTVGLRELPVEIGNLTNLTSLDLSWNRLSHLPAEIGNLSNLTSLALGVNQLSSLPAEIGNLNNLRYIHLSRNRLSTLPAEIGNLNNLNYLFVSRNQLSSLPVEIGNLANLSEMAFEYNRLVIPDSDFRSFLTEYAGNWSATQTVALTKVAAIVMEDNRIELTWIPIAFQDKRGYYEISIAEDDSFTVHGTTADKSVSRYMIQGLTRGRVYNIRVRTYTPPHDGIPASLYDDQENELWSDYSPTISVTMPSSTNTPTVLEENEEPLEYKLFLPVIGN